MAGAFGPPPSWDDLGGGGDDIRRARGVVGLQAYEDRAARFVLPKLGRGRDMAAVASVAAGRYGTPRFTFSAIEEVDPLPVRFAVARIRNVKFLAIPDLFDRFHRLSIWKHYVEEFDDGGRDRRSGVLIFPFRGDAANRGPKGGNFFALHTADCYPQRGPRITIPIDFRGEPEVAILEPLGAICAAIGASGD